MSWGQSPRDIPRKSHTSPSLDRKSGILFSRGTRLQFWPCLSVCLSVCSIKLLAMAWVQSYETDWSLKPPCPTVSPCSLLLYKYSVQLYSVLCTVHSCTVYFVLCTVVQSFSSEQEISSWSEDLVSFSFYLTFVLVTYEIYANKSKIKTKQ